MFVRAYFLRWLGQGAERLTGLRKRFPVRQPARAATLMGGYQRYRKREADMGTSSVLKAVAGSDHAEHSSNSFCAAAIGGRIHKSPIALDVEDLVDDLRDVQKAYSGLANLMQSQTQRLDLAGSGIAELMRIMNSEFERKIGALSTAVGEVGRSTSA